MHYKSDLQHKEYLLDLAVLVEVLVVLVEVLVVLVEVLVEVLEVDLD